MQIVITISNIESNKLSGLFVSNLDNETGIEYFTELTEREAQLKLLGYCTSDKHTVIYVYDSLIEMAKQVKLSLGTLYDLLWNASALERRISILAYCKLITEAKNYLANNEDRLVMYTPTNGVGTIYHLMTACKEIEQFILTNYYTDAKYRFYARKENEKLF